ncbi:putative uncharacterized protein DDB_G0282133 [Pseudomyrmex gracilis]|uniref:putative uncharacterized protein DDB_G0282133 n=1 Tax=Pseudomyrmex gracilis TaxID=219809 RepID=UPI000995C7E1|nr:putative uncharacterized protein DDB_G0282133 [Pseudomyrmex gracilis]
MGRHHNMQLAFFVTLIFCELALSQLLDLFGTKGTKIIISRNDSVTCKAERECTDCVSGRICIGEEKKTQIGLLICDEDTPYCNSGKCSKTPDPKLGCTPPCPVNGVLPDPTDCTRYIRCAEHVATVNQCPIHNVYDHATGNCKYSRRISDCVNFDCRGREGQIVVYPRDNRLYAICADNVPVILGRCKDYQKYDLTEDKCVRHCTQVGNQPPDDLDSEETCGKYYRCVQTSILPWQTSYEPVEMSCACNEGYNETIKDCSTNARCLNGTTRCPTKQLSPLIINNSGDSNNDNEVSNGNDDVDGNLVNGNDNGDNSDSGNVANGGPSASPLIINNSGTGNSNNSVSNGNDNADGNIVNGNENGDNSDSGNVANNRPTPVPFIIISGDKNNNNKVSNSNNGGNLVNGNANGANSNSGSDSGNLVNGNNNGDNSNSGNVENSGIAQLSPLIIKNSGNDNDNNKVSDGDSSVNGNLVNGNGNGDNSKSGNVKRRSVSPLIINSSGNDNSNNDISNGSDDVDGNAVNGNTNGNNKNSGNVNNNQPPASPPVDNSGSNDNERNNNTSNDSENEKDGSGDLNDNNNPDESQQPAEDPDKSQPKEDVGPEKLSLIEDPSEPQIKDLFSIVIDWVIRVVIGQ